MISLTHVIIFTTLSFWYGLFIHLILSLLLIQIKPCFESLCNHFNEVVVFAAVCLF